MELLLLLPLLLLGGVLGGGGGASGEDESGPTPSEQNGEIEAGTSDGEELSGTVLNDILLGAGANDTLEGLGGDDVLLGEFGADDLTGDAGNDIVLGGAGADRLFGEDGVDLLIGGAGNDSLSGGSGDDALIGSGGSDTLSGGDGDDVLIGMEFGRISGELDQAFSGLATTLTRTFGADMTPRLLSRIEAGVASGSADELGADLLYGGTGDDVLGGDQGDTLTGGAGTDDFGISHLAGDAAVTVTDFDPATEALTLMIANPATASVVIQADGTQNSVLVVDGQTVARLLGRTVAELSADTSSWLFVQQG